MRRFRLPLTGFLTLTTETRTRAFLPGRLAALALAVAANSKASPALAWVYHEHRDIAILAVEGLDRERRETFDVLWSEARAGSEERLCARGADTEQGVTPPCIDWAAMPAIAGDHSCSAREMVETVLDSDWILEVADVSAQLKLDLAQIEVSAPAEQQEDEGAAKDVRRRLASRAARAKRTNALRTADTRLQRADPEYATRAGSNNAHFLLARPAVDTSPLEYAIATMSPGTEISATGVYVRYHLIALGKAARLAEGTLTPEQRQALARTTLADEAFALHFLEDMYAAGHIAGTWGDASQRKGTHDYYNEAGLEVFSWEAGTKNSMVLMGDAHMRPEDAELAAGAVRRSLSQVLDVAAGRRGAHKVTPAPASAMGPTAFDVCHSMTMPPRVEGQNLARDVETAGLPLGEVLLPTAVPSLGPGLGSMPRSRSEVGPFAGLVACINARALSGGFVNGQSAGAIGGLDVAARLGVGLEGVLGEAGDGLVYVQLGVRLDTPSSSSVNESTLAQQGGSITAAIPARTGLSTRFRMPFYLVPGDLLFLSPIYLASPETYTKIAVTASNGGFIPWQLGRATRIGRFQVVLGRELGVTFYVVGGNDRLIVPGGESGSGGGKLVDYTSTWFDLPILEYRPYRAFTSTQSSEIQFQLFAGADVPSRGTVVTPPGQRSVSLETVWSVGLRFAFDWRYYF